MLGMKKSALKGKEKRRKVSFRSFGEKNRSEGNLYPIAYENCDCRGGVLQGGIGVKEKTDENGMAMSVASNYWTSAPNTFFVNVKKDSSPTITTAIYVAGLDDYLYLREEESGEGVRKVFLGDHVEHCAMRTEDNTICNIFSGSQKAYATLDGFSFRCVLAASNVGSCICSKRFVMMRSDGMLFYTAMFDLYAMEPEPDGQGHIYFPSGYGLPVGMKKYGEKVYVFFEKGIFKVSISAFAKQHKVEIIPYNGGKICLRAQVLTKDGIMFLASDGAYYLRKDSVKKICEHLPIGPCCTEQSCNVGYCDDVVFFHYYKRARNGSIPTYLVLYQDGEDGYFTENFGSFGGNEYTYFSNAIHYYTKNSEGIKWANTPRFSSEGLDFGTSKKKRLKELCLTGKGSVTVGITCGGYERMYKFNFVEGKAKTRLFEKGKEFGFTFYLEANTVVTGMDVHYIAEE